MEELFIPVFAGTNRKGRMTIGAARLVVEAADEIDGVTSELIDVADYQFPADDYKVQNETYTELVTRADGYVIVAPEYNHGIPGTLKQLLDSVNKRYTHKPVGLAGVSAGPWGGIRGVQSMVPLVRELGMVVTFSDIYFPSVQNMFNEDASVKDQEAASAQKERIKDAFVELVWLAKTLKWGRENVPNKFHDM